MEATYKLSGAADCRDAIATLRGGDVLTIDADGERPGGLIVRSADSRAVGRLTGRHPVAEAIAGGAVVLHCSVNSVTSSAVRARIVTGGADETYTAAPELPAQHYTVSVVGESFHQPALASCRAGDAVAVFHETANPHDDMALAVAISDGRLIGRIGRDSWVHRAIFDERRAIAATIGSLGRGATGLYGAILDAQVIAGPVETRRYAPDAPPAPRTRWGERLRAWLT